MMTKRTFILFAIIIPASWSWSQDSTEVDVPFVLSANVFAEGQWASNAVSKWAMAGATFGGDISAPVRSLTALTHWKGGGIAGGMARSGIELVLPAMDFLPAPEKGRWRTVVALEHVRWAHAEWSPAAATLVFGRHGIGDDGSLADTRYRLQSATMLRIGGVRTHPGTLRGIPMDWSVEWGIRMGEMHRSMIGGTSGSSTYQWDDETASATLEGMQFSNLTAGSAVGFDLAVGMAEADGGHGRHDSWSVSIRNLGRSGRYLTDFSRIDTAFVTEGWPLFTGETPDFSDLVGERDTLIIGFARNLPSTLAFRWDRQAIRLPGVIWTLTARKLSIAPRWEWSLTRRSGRGAVQTEIGLAWGGWGGTFIPLNFNMPSRAVRQGRPGGTLAVRTRWLALAGTGGRMGLGLNWHRSF